MALDTVSDYVNEARVLLQDLDQPYRYEDSQLVSALNIALMEARKLRPDLFLNTRTFPSFTTNDATTVSFDIQYRAALLNYIVGYAQLRDDEGNQDQRASAFLNRFSAQMLGLA